MAELKTKETSSSVQTYLDAIDPMLEKLVAEPLAERRRRYPE